MKNKQSKSTRFTYSKSRMYFPQTVVLLLVVFFLILLSVSNTQQPVQKVAGATSKALDMFTEEPTVTPTAHPVPVRNLKAIDPVLTARAALVVDRASGEVLYEKNKDLPLWPASTTKIMTALVALDQFGRDEIVTVSNPVTEGRIMSLKHGERISVESLVQAILIHSANDAAYALADHYPGGREAFISQMNQKARALNLINTHFVNPAGFDNDKQYSTASDLVTLMMHALNHPVIARNISIRSITISDNDYVTFHRLDNVNELLGTMPGVAGGKTGWTENAKENLINITKRNDREIVSIILGSDDRFGETQLLTEWIFTNYTWPGQEIPTITPTATPVILYQQLPLDQQGETLIPVQTTPGL